MKSNLLQVLDLSKPNALSQGALPAADVEAGTIESKYASVYEERNNPFIDWKEREKASRKRQLNMADRIMFEFGQFISSSQ